MRHSRGRVAARPPYDPAHPGPRPTPLNLLGWTLRPEPCMEQCRARYGDRFTGARVLELVVGSRSVLLLDGAEHLAQRKLMR